MTIDDRRPPTILQSDECGGSAEQRGHSLDVGEATQGLFAQREHPGKVRDSIDRTALGIDYHPDDT